MTPEPAPGGLLDTSIFIARESGRALDLGLVPPGARISVITLAELELGVHAARDPQTRSRRIRTFEALSGYTPLPVDARAAGHWARLRFRLHEEGRKAGVNDLWIAAIALAHDLPVVTQDADFDVFADLEGPTVIRV